MLYSRSTSSFWMVLSIEPRALHMLRIHSPVNSTLQPLFCTLVERSLKAKAKEWYKLRKENHEVASSQPIFVLWCKP